MTREEIVEGRRYRAVIGRKKVTVVVNTIQEVITLRYDGYTRKGYHYAVTILATGRKHIFRTVKPFLEEVEARVFPVTVRVPRARDVRICRCPDCDKTYMDCDCK